MALWIIAILLIAVILFGFEGTRNVLLGLLYIAAVLLTGLATCALLLFATGVY